MRRRDGRAGGLSTGFALADVAGNTGAVPLAKNFSQVRLAQWNEAALGGKHLSKQSHALILNGVTVHTEFLVS